MIDSIIVYFYDIFEPYDINKINEKISNERINNVISLDNNNFYVDKLLNLDKYDYTCIFLLGIFTIIHFVK